MTPPSSFLGVSKYQSTKLDSVVVVSPSTSSSQNVRFIRGNFERPSTTDTSALLKGDDQKDESDRDVDIVTNSVQTDSRLSKRDDFELDNNIFENVEDESLSVSALRYILKSSTEPEGVTGAGSQHTDSNRTHALHSSIAKDEFWLSNGISRPRRDDMRDTPELQRPEPELLFVEQGGWPDARIDECTRQVEAMITEGIDALAAEASHQEEHVSEFTPEETSDHEGLWAAAALCHGWTTPQSNLIRDIESMLG